MLIASAASELGTPVLTVLDPNPPSSMEPGWTVDAYELEQPDGVTASGWLALPDVKNPTTLVILCHGFGYPAGALRPFMEELAGHGAVVVAMDYRGSLGSFNVQYGVQDTVSATRDLLERFPSVSRTIIYGYSMGGAVAGLTVAAMPSGTFDVWVSGSGVADAEELWETVPALRPAIEHEMGGAPGETARYEELSVLNALDDIANKQLASVVLVHARADPIVPSKQSETIHELLVARNVPTVYFEVVGQQPPWGCAGDAAPCNEDPMPTMDSHGAGDVAFFGAVLHSLVKDAWPMAPTGPVRLSVEGEAGVEPVLESLLAGFTNSDEF